MEQVLLVTGGSRGIGAATALLAAGAGYAVAVNYVGREDAASEVVQRIGAGGGRATAVQGDVASEADVLRLQHVILESRPLRTRPDVGLVRSRWEMSNQRGEAVMQMEGYGMFRRRHPATPDEMDRCETNGDKD